MSKTVVHIVGTGTKLSPRRGPDAVGAVGFGADVPTMTAGHADDLAAQNQPGRHA